MPRPRTTLSPSPSSSRNRNSLKESNLCQFPFNDGRRCRMLRHPAHPNLCPFHARAELQILESGSLGTQLSQTVSGEFNTATDVNHLLGKLYTAVAQDRVPARNAATLAYIAQLLLHSVDGVKDEFKFSYTFDQWNDMNNEAKPLSPPPSLATPALDVPTATAIVPSAQTEPPESQPSAETTTISPLGGDKPGS